MSILSASRKGNEVNAYAPTQRPKRTVSGLKKRFCKAIDRENSGEPQEGRSAPTITRTISRPKKLVRKDTGRNANFGPEFHVSVPPFIFGGQRVAFLDLLGNLREAARKSPRYTPQKGMLMLRLATLGRMVPGTSAQAGIFDDLLNRTTSPGVGEPVFTPFPKRKTTSGATLRGPKNALVDASSGKEVASPSVSPLRTLIAESRLQAWVEHYWGFLPAPQWGEPVLARDIALPSYARGTPSGITYVARAPPPATAMMRLASLLPRRFVRSNVDRAKFVAVPVPPATREARAAGGHGPGSLGGWNDVPQARIGVNYTWHLYK